MCLAIPGVVKSIDGTDPLNRMAEVVFGGVTLQINFSCLPEVKVGDYVIAHAGVALQAIDEEEALKVIEDLKQMEKALGPYEISQ